MAGHSTGALRGAEVLTDEADKRANAWKQSRTPAPTPTDSKQEWYGRMKLHWEAREALYKRGAAAGTPMAD